MQRREFLLSIFGGAVGGLPSTGAGSPQEVWEQRARRLLKNVEDLNRKSAIAARYRTEMLTLVHGMRAPLACVSVLTDIMRDTARDDLSGELRRNLETSARNCERVAELINEVFALEKSRRDAEVPSLEQAAET